MQSQSSGCSWSQRHFRDEIADGLDRLGYSCLMEFVSVRLWTSQSLEFVISKLKVQSRARLCWSRTPYITESDRIGIHIPTLKTDLTKNQIIKTPDHHRSITFTLYTFNIKKVNIQNFGFKWFSNPIQNTLQQNLIKSRAKCMCKRRKFE